MGSKRVAFSVVSLKSNQYIALLSAGLNANDVEIVPISLLDVFFRRVGVVHVHWPEHFLRRLNKLSHVRLLVRFLLTLKVAKLRSIPVVWTVHNIWPHDSKVSPAVTRAFFRHWASSVDGCIYMTPSTKKVCEDAHPAVIGARSVVIPHGHYKQVIPVGLGKAECRAKFDIPSNDFVFGHLGLIRAYKNTERLMTAFSALVDDKLRLIVAGKCDDRKLSQRLAALAFNDKRICFINKHLSDAEMAELTIASDVIVLPYAQVANSGVALFALSAARPVVGPRLGGFIDLGQEFSEWFQLYDGDFDKSVFAEAFSRFVECAQKEGPNLKGLDWITLARDTVQFYDSLQ